MSDQPNMPFDPRVPKPETPVQPPAEPPTVFEDMSAPAPTPPPAAPSPPPTPTPAPPPMPPAAAPAPTPPPAAPPSTPPPMAPPTPPSYGAPPSAPGHPYGQPPITEQVPAQSFAPVGGKAGPPSFDPPSSSAASSGGGGGRGALIAVGVVLVAAIAGIAALVLTGGDDEADVTAPTTVPVATLPNQTTPTTQVDTPDAETSLPPNMTASVAELAESTVQILVLSGGTPVCSGSGTIIDDQGTILTNAHVIEPGGPCAYDSIGIAITTDAGRPPELLYLADVYAYDPVVDLAVVRIATDLDGVAAPGPFKSVPVGDSDAVQIGDQLRILGYPGIGGDTVTFTNGVVSGFASQNGIGDRSWIKTDATIAGGNSGGAGFDDDGRLVGIPTQASASSSGDVVDCRVITDTNGDGSIDGADQCVPIGGFLNGLRPINLALPLIEEASSGSPISIQAEVAPSTGGTDLSGLSIFNPRWSLDASVEASFSPQFVRTAAAGAEKLCFWFDWSALPDGAIWDGVWRVDGVVNEDFSFFSEEWASGDAGENYWLCAIETTGLASGLYEFLFYIEGDVIFYESFEITDAPRALHDITFVNNSTAPVCYLYIAPFGSEDTGLDELGTTEILETGTSKTVAIPEGVVLIDAYDCDFNLVYEQFDGLSVTGPASIEITGS